MDNLPKERGTGKACRLFYLGFESTVGNKVSTHQYGRQRGSHPDNKLGSSNGCRYPDRPPPTPSQSFHPVLFGSRVISVVLDDECIPRCIEPIRHLFRRSYYLGLRIYRVDQAISICCMGKMAFRASASIAASSRLGAAAIRPTIKAANEGVRT